MQDWNSFFRLFCHELRSPLASARGFSQELAADLNRMLKGSGEEPAPGFRSEAAATLFDSLERLLRSVDRMDALLSAAQQHASLLGQEMRPERVDLNAVLHRLQARLEPEFREAGAALRMQPLPWVWGDARLLSALLERLLHNALQNRSPERPLAVEVSGEAAGGRARLEIRDNGRGLPEGWPESGWEPFRRGPESAGAGTGLGLATAGALAGRQGGALSLKRLPGGGTLATIELPTSPNA